MITHTHTKKYRTMHHIHKSANNPCKSKSWKGDRVCMFYPHTQTLTIVDFLVCLFTSRAASFFGVRLRDCMVFTRCTLLPGLICGSLGLAGWDWSYSATKFDSINANIRSHWISERNSGISSNSHDKTTQTLNTKREEIYSLPIFHFDSD